MEEKRTKVKIVVLKQLPDERPEEGWTLEKQIEARSFIYEEADILYDKPLVEAALNFSQKGFIEEDDVEVFEVKGNYIFTSHGIFMVVYKQWIVPEDEFNRDLLCGPEGGE